MEKNVTENKKLIVSSTPHIRGGETTQGIMLDVLLALGPAAVMGALRFGPSAVSVMGISVMACVFFEWAYRKIMKKTSTVMDLSAAVTGLLLAFNLPASVPLWLPVVGAFVAIVIVKQLFGGIGQNFINPALGARAFLMAAYLPEMTDWSVAPKTDIVASVTPLAKLAGGNFIPASSDYWAALWGNVGGCIGETCAAALLAGGAYLLIRRVISWRIPVAYGLTAALLTWAFGRGGGAFTGYPVYELLTGGFLLGALFMATDYTTSPITPLGQIIMGVGCGILTALIRVVGHGYPEGVSYSILLMNLAVPLIDKAIRPRVYGRVKAKKGAVK